MSIMNQPKINNNLTFIDLFSGAGGLLRGFIDAGFEASFSVEMWEPAIETHNKNYPLVPLLNADIRTISNDELIKYPNAIHQPIKCCFATSSWASSQRRIKKTGMIRIMMCMNKLAP